MKTWPRLFAVVPACLLAFAVASPAHAVYDRKEDPTGEKRLALEIKLCGNVYLRQSLQRQLSRAGDPNNGARPILNCFKKASEKTNSTKTYMLMALDNACPGAAVTSWIDQPRLIPAKGCGDNYAQPDWGTIPFVRN